MPFQHLPSSRTVRWAPARGDGLEHLTIAQTPRGPLARSVVTGEFEGALFGATYEIACDPSWRVLLLRLESTAGHRLALLSPEPGRWVDETGRHRDDLDGAIDVDLAGSPFTNTLPIRRLALGETDGEATVSVLYLPFDTFEPFLARQHYRALGGDRMYRFATEDRAFEADLPVDEHGLVLDYPGLFRRL